MLCLESEYSTVRTKVKLILGVRPWEEQDFSLLLSHRDEKEAL